MFENTMMCACTKKLFTFHEWTVNPKMSLKATLMGYGIKCKSKQDPHAWTYKLHYAWDVKWQYSHDYL
jgi:hypothetical protein